MTKSVTCSYTTIGDGFDSLERLGMVTESDLQQYDVPTGHRRHIMRAIAVDLYAQTSKTQHNPNTNPAKTLTTKQSRENDSVVLDRSNAGEKISPNVRRELKQPFLATGLRKIS
jgi:hypothetical protein